MTGSHWVEPHREVPSARQSIYKTRFLHAAGYVLADPRKRPGVNELSERFAVEAEIVSLVNDAFHQFPTTALQQ